MPGDRFYLPQSFSVGSTKTLKDQELHHLLHVMRVRSGETIELINGVGQLAKALVEKIEKQVAHLRIEKVESEEQPKYSLILAQALPRLPRLEYILEKATELGASEIWLFPSDLSERKDLSPNQFQRLQQILVASLKQCGRLFLPKILLKPPLFSWRRLSIPSFFGDTAEGAPPLLQVVDRMAAKEILWMVGPEAGFTEKEMHYLTDSLSFKGVSLHKNTLRVDTAAIAGLSLLSSISFEKN